MLLDKRHNLYDNIIITKCNAFLGYRSSLVTHIYIYIFKDFFIIKQSTSFPVKLILQEFNIDQDYNP